MRSTLTEYEQAIQDAGIPLVEMMPGFGFEYDYMHLMLKQIDAAGGMKTPHEFGRWDFVHKFGFAIPNVGALEVIARHAPILEVGCGTGYWAYELQKLGVSVVATDPHLVSQEVHPIYKFWKSWLARIDQMDGVEAVKTFRGRTLLIVWPSLGQSWCTETLKAYDGQTVIYVGEFGDCCGEEVFFELLQEKFEEVQFVKIPRWYGIYDSMWVFKRKAG